MTYYCEKPYVRDLDLFKKKFPSETARNSTDKIKNRIPILKI